MEVQDNTDRDVEAPPDAPEQVVAKPGGKYPIRLLHMVSGMIVIGFIIEVFPQTTMVLRPHIVDICFDTKTDNIDEYEFTPYLDQLAENNPMDLVPTPFMNTAVISIAKPASHVIDNYISFIQIKEAVATVPEDREIQIYRRAIVNPKTKH